MVRDQLQQLTPSHTTTAMVAIGTSTSEIGGVVGCTSPSVPTDVKNDIYILLSREWFTDEDIDSERANMRTIFAE